MRENGTMSGIGYQRTESHGEEVSGDIVRLVGGKRQDHGCMCVNIHCINVQLLQLKSQLSLSGSPTTTAGNRFREINPAQHSWPRLDAMRGKNQTWTRKR